MKSICQILVICVSFVTYCSHAEVYRWVDDDGNVHFSDKKPEQNDVEDISESVANTNIDESSKAMRRLDQVLSETEGEKQVRNKKEYNDRIAQERQNRICEKARDDLRILRGRVVIVDENGVTQSMSESQRKIEAQKLESEIKNRCK